jgi:hypothetical protein
LRFSTLHRQFALFVNPHLKRSLLKSSENATGLSRGPLRLLLQTAGYTTVDATGLSGGASRSLLAVNVVQATPVTIHGTSPWHFMIGTAAVCSRKRNHPPVKPVAFG